MEIKNFGRYITLYPPYLDMVDLTTIKPCRITFAGLGGSIEEVEQFSKDLNDALRMGFFMNTAIVIGASNEASVTKDDKTKFIENLWNKFNK